MRNWAGGEMKLGLCDWIAGGKQISCVNRC